MNEFATKVIAVCALLAALVGGTMLYGHSQYKQGQQERKTFYEAALTKQKGEAAQLLADETAKVREIERQLREFVSNQEKKDAVNQQTVDDLSARYNRLVGKSGRLRDPNATGCGQGSGGTKSAESTTPQDSAGDGAKEGGLLSVPLSALLRGALRDADNINNAYASCRPFALKSGATPKD